MKVSSRVLGLLLVWMAMCVSTMGAGAGAFSGLREGDILFTGSEQGQGAAIMAATGSRFTHCGVVFMHDGQLMVLEAVHPVKVTSIRDFLGRARPSAIAAKRLIKFPAPEKIAEAKKWAAAQIGRDYDKRFQWGDDRLYCSELVWKIFHKAGVDLCKPRAVSEYQLDHPKVRALIRERFGGMEKLKMSEKVVAPSDISDSPLLEDVPVASPKKS